MTKSLRPVSPAGFVELRDRLIREFRGDPTACWLKIVDTDIGDKVVGAALWNKYTENPYPIYKDHPMEAYWWPKGELCWWEMGVSAGLLTFPAG